MVASAIKLLSGLVVTLVIVNPAVSASQASQNILHITGRIVADPCVVSPVQHAIELSCLQNGKMQTRNISYRTASGPTPVKTGEADLSIKYLDPARKLAIIQLDYY